MRPHRQPTAKNVVSLQDFIETHHDKLVSMAKGKVAKRNAGSRPAGLETKHGVHLFLEQLRGALEDEAKRDPSQQAQPDPPTNPDISKTAALHGHDLLLVRTRTRALWSGGMSP